LRAAARNDRSTDRIGQHRSVGEIGTNRVLPLARFGCWDANCPVNIAGGLWDRYQPRLSGFRVVMCCGIERLPSNGVGEVIEGGRRRRVAGLALSNGRD